MYMGLFCILMGWLEYVHVFYLLDNLAPLRFLVGAVDSEQLLANEVKRLCWRNKCLSYVGLQVPNRYDSCQWKPVALFWQRHCIWWCLVNIRREIIFQERDTHGHQVVWVSETNSGPVHGEAPAFTIKAYVVFPLAERGDKLTTAPWNICLPFLPKFMVNDGKCKDSFPMEQLAYMRQMLMLLFLLRS